jgi:translation initiation factor IF-1
MKETKETHIEVEGVVAQVLPGTMFRVRITTGDRVKMEMSPYDLNKARITWRVR